MTAPAPPVIVTSAAAVIRRGVPSIAAHWVYLGKDVRTRGRVESILGPARLQPLDGRLHRIAADLRQPFLDFVAEIGSTQLDALTWWSTTLSWKVWGASDLFLLTCYLRLANDLIGDAVAGRTSLILVIEDAWLLVQIRRNWSGNPVVHARGGPLVGIKSVAVVLGIARRSSWLVRMLASSARQWWLWPRESSDPWVHSTVAIYSYPMARCLREGGGWTDPFLPGLDSMLRDLGHEVVRFSPPDPTGFEYHLAERAAYFQPLIRYCTAGALVRALAVVWLPRRRRWPRVSGLCIDELARREWWLEMARASLCRYRLFFECAKRMLAAGPWQWVVFPYENQPWEKLLVLAARQRGIRTAGIQHSTLSVNYLSYFLGRGEAERMPIPDVVLTSGAYAQNAFDRGGYPPGRSRLIGTIRYPHLATLRPVQNSPAPPRSDVLVALPIDRPMAEHLITAIAAAFPDGGRSAGIRFHVKPHPGTPVDPGTLGLSASIIGPADDALLLCGSVLYVATTLGPEAAAHGRAVLRYRPELLLDVDVSEGLADAIPTCGDRDLREKLLAVIAAQQTPADRTQLLNALFTPFSRELLHEIFPPVPAPGHRHEIGPADRVQADDFGGRHEKAV